MNTFERSEINEVYIYNEVHESFGPPEQPSRTLDNTEPLQSGVFGKAGQWKVIFKAWNHDEKWFKSTKALEIPGFGCLVQTTNQQNGQISDALESIPGVRLEPTGDGTFRLVAGIPDAV
jgi:hypothetical protein